MSDAELEETGPIDFLIVEFPPDLKPDGSGLNLLRELVLQGTINLLDIGFFRAEHDGSVVPVAITDVGFGDEIDVSLFAEASSGLLTEDDYAEAARALQPGCLGGVLVYENAWAAPFATALRGKGAQLVGFGRLPVQSILAALDATEPTA